MPDILEEVLYFVVHPSMEENYLRSFHICVL